MQGIQGSLYDGHNGGCLRRQKPAPSSCGAAAAAPHDDGLVKSRAAPEPEITAVVEAPPPSILARLAERYLHEEVYGILTTNTFKAKASDLQGFIEWFTRQHPEADAPWKRHDTADYIAELKRIKRKPATINRALGTLKTFAMWALEQPEGIFRTHGLPTRGVRTQHVPPPTCKKIPEDAVRELQRAADRLTRTRTHANQRPWRDRAIFMVLLHTGLRAHEVAGLEIGQFTGKFLLRVRRKGDIESPAVFLSTACRKAIEDYISYERPRDACNSADAYPDADQAPLFFANGRAMRRQHLNEILATIAREASDDENKPLRVSPHMLRHTFGAKHREASGSDGETAAALGHVGIANVARYTRKTDEERAELIEGLF